MRVNIITYFIILFIGINNTYAQWIEQLDCQNFLSFERVFFLDENLGWAVGSAYFYTEDGGENWYLDENWFDNNCNDLVFFNQDTGLITANTSFIKKTINGGQDWELIEIPAENTVMRFQFVNENTGWATLGGYSDGKILNTTNGGDSWEVQDAIPQSAGGAIEAICFIDENIGWANGAYYIGDDLHVIINKTMNGGNSWSPLFTVINEHYSIKDLFFIDTLNGWAVGSKTNNYLLLHTSDGGENWEEQELSTELLEPGTDIRIINCVYFIDENIGWLGVDAGNTNNPYGFIYFTTDGGEHWEIQDNFYHPIYDIQVVNEDLGWAVGEDFIYHTENANNYLWLGEKDPTITHCALRTSPNPSNGSFSLWHPFESDIALSIVNFLGEVVYQKDYIANINPIPLILEDLPPGYYIIQVQSKNEIKTTMIIIN